MCRPVFRVAVVVFLFSGALTALGQGNTDPVYLQLRKIGLGSERITVNNVVLKRDAGTFTFAAGTICFLAPVQGKVTGAVFSGTGTFSLEPPLSGEKGFLRLLIGNQPMKEEFNEVVLRFTDDSYEQLKKASGATAGGASCPPDMLGDNAGTLQHKLHYNLSGRILQDVLGDGTGGLFMAFIKGKKYSGKLLYAIDPHGVPELPGRSWEGSLPSLSVAPEEVMLMTWDENKFGIWSAFHLADEYATGKATSAQQNDVISIEKQELDTTIEKGGKLNGKASTTFLSRTANLRVVPFNLFPTLRVQNVTDASGQPLGFIQEDKGDDPQFFVVLPKALGVGERFTVVTAYSGKDAVSSEGEGNYYPVARDDWYPNSRLGSYASFDMRFAIPKGLTMVATGVRVGEEVVEGSQVLTRWRSEQPQTVAGFQFGRFKKMEAKLDKLGFALESYANTEVPDAIRDLQRNIESVERQGYRTMTTLQTINTTGQISKALAEAQLAVPLFTDYFGAVPFKRLAITQQTASSYGQAWPELVWLPMSYFWDGTIRHQLGMDDPRGYFKAVASHEIAHQWWGHAIGWASYRDQWMSEGFAEAAASLYLQFLQQQKPQEFIKFWDDERELLLERNKEGFRAIDVAPVTLGYRAYSSKAGFDVTRRLIYPKGGYILHMLRMMMWDPKTFDQHFKELMQDFVKTYTNRPATTEDFKAMVEKHMTPAMDLTGNRRMDWFFDEYVYGTALPRYKFDHSFTKGPDGDYVLNFTLAQSDVDNDFRMMIPIYLELAGGKVIRLGTLPIAGNKSTEQHIPLRGVKEPPKRAMIAYFDDVLAQIEK